MIDPKELRMGNLVYSRHPSFTNIYDKALAVGTVDSFDHGTIWIKEYYNEMSYRHIEPIPITHEWLERLGFRYEEADSFSEYFNKSFGKTKAYITDRIWFCSHFDWMCHKEISPDSKRGWYVGRRNTNKRYNGWNYSQSAEVMFVHQLQNVIFALTGTELEVKQPETT